MKVILQQDIPKVGRGGDIVNVADGYARNYLFPRKYAVSATGGALKEHQARATREKERGAGLLQGAEASAAKIQGKMVTILTKAGTGTKLYGSVTSQDVADAVNRETGVTVDKRRVGLADPIKMLGEYIIPVRLHADVSVNVKVLVITEEELVKRKAAEAAAAKAAADAAAIEAARAAASPVETPAEAPMEAASSQESPLETSVPEAHAETPTGTFLDDAPDAEVAHEE